MSLKPPSLWIEKRGRQNRVYWRNPPGLGLAARSYQRFYSRADAEQFVSMAAYFGLETARQVTATEDVAARRALLDTALAERGLMPADPAPVPGPVMPLVPAAPAHLGKPANPRLTGVSFRQLWTTFLERQRHLRKGTRTLYESYGEYHLLPFFGETTPR
jgi:hypothetical protein